MSLIQTLGSLYPFPLMFLQYLYLKFPYDNHFNRYFQNAIDSPKRVDSERWARDYGFPGDVWLLEIVVLEYLVGHYPLIGLVEKLDLVALICAICFRERLEMSETTSWKSCSFMRSCLENLKFTNLETT